MKCWKAWTTRCVSSGGNARFERTVIPPLLNTLTSPLTPLTPNAGMTPYDVNVPFWSDNARKTRWFFMPTNGATIGFNANGNWSFPGGMAWVKHFDLELTNGVPASSRRLETRILVKTGVKRRRRCSAADRQRRREMAHAIRRERGAPIRKT